MNDEYAQVGDSIAPYLPTPRIRWFQPNGATVPHLQQWFEARAVAAHGSIHTKGEWRLVPTESTN